MITQKISPEVRCLLFSLISQIYGTLKQPRLEGALEDHLIQPFVGNGAWMRLLLHMKNALIFNIYVVQITQCESEKKVFLQNSRVNRTVPASVDLCKSSQTPG